MPPWNLEPRWRFLLLTLSRAANQMTSMIRTKSTRLRMGNLVLNLVLAKRKTRRCILPYSKIKFWVSTIPSYFMKFTIVMKYAKKITYILFRCRDKMNMIQKSFIKELLKCRRKVHSFRTKVALTPLLSTLSTQSWNLIAKALIQ